MLHSAMYNCSTEYDNIKWCLFPVSVYTVVGYFAPIPFDKPQGEFFSWSQQR